MPYLSRNLFEGCLLKWSHKSEAGSPGYGNDGGSGRARKFATITAVFFTSVLFATPQAAMAQHMNATDAPCQEYAVTVEIAQCLDGAIKKADADLNATYRTILQSLHADEKPLLVSAQRLWIRYRDAFCAAERSLYGNGTASGPAHLACVEAMTRHKTQELRSAYWWHVEKFSE